LYEDDDAFFERLAEMTDVLETQDWNNEEEERESKIQDLEQRVTRSGRTVKAPTRLIEEMGALSEEEEAKTSWKECLIKAYKIALVGAGSVVDSTIQAS
jgi:hypothetical protein